MKYLLTGVLCVLLTACTFMVEINDSPYRVEINPVGETATTPPQPTSTVTPTRTPTPTVEAPTVTPEPEPSPTQDTTPINLCVATVDVAVRNIRASASTAGQLVTQVTKGYQFYPVVKTTGGGNTWYGFWYDKDAEIFAYTITSGITLTGDCDALKTSWGFWVGTGANRDHLLQAGRDLKAAGVHPAATVYGEPETARLLYQNGWIVAFRPSIGNCPRFTENATAVAKDWFRRAVADAGSVPYTWLVLSNECVFPNDDYHVEWTRTVIEEARTIGLRGLVPIVYSTGAPEVAVVRRLAPLYRDAKIPICWGMNIYPYYGEKLLTVYDDETKYTTWRYEQYQEILKDIPFCVTEFASGTGSSLPDFPSIGNWVKATDGVWEFATIWYDAGVSFGEWDQANLQGQLDRFTSFFQ